MCTCFAYHSERRRLVAMKFDNDGRAVRLASLTGIFVNDLNVDDQGQGRYARQSERRWVSDSGVARRLTRSGMALAELLPTSSRE